jgi:CRP-like cAMP-binding protein
MALLLGEKRSATLKALSGVVATRVRKEDIRDFSENEGASLFSGIASALARRHYYNVIKIGNINRSIIEHAVDSSEEGTSRIPASHRAMKDLGSLKSKLDDAVSAKKADFLSDLQSI